MLFQPLSPDESTRELAFLIFRRVNDDYYEYWHLACDLRIIPYSDRMAEALIYDARRARAHYSMAGGDCIHRFIPNEHGHMICARCHQFSLLLTVSRE